MSEGEREPISERARRLCFEINDQAEDHPSDGRCNHCRMIQATFTAERSDALREQAEEVMKLRNTLMECLIQAPHDVTRAMDGTNCLCRWCRAHRLVIRADALDKR